MIGRALIIQETILDGPLLVPEILLHLITQDCRLWRAGEKELADVGLSDPYWAFAWPGGQALGRFVIDHEPMIRDKTVLDFGSGSGLVAIAAARAGALHVIASDIDPIATTAITMNAEINDIEETLIETTTRDLIGIDEGWDVVLAGDVCYDAKLTERIVEWLQTLAKRGALVLIGDPGRGFLKLGEHDELAVYDAPADIDSDGRHRRRTSVLQIRDR